MAEVASQKEVRVCISTRGYSYANEYEWKASWQNQDDRMSDDVSRSELRKYSLYQKIQDLYPGFVLGKFREQYALLIEGIPTNYHAAGPGKIFASFAFFDISEKDCKDILVACLRNTKATSELLLKCILRHSPPAANPEWSISQEHILEFLKIVTQNSSIAEITSYFRRTEPYSGVGDYLSLADIVAEQGFSSGDGVKLVIGDACSSDASKEILREADFAAMGGLEKKKGNAILPPLPPPPPLEPTPQRTSGGQSEPSHEQPSAKNLPVPVANSPSSGTSSIPLPIPSSNGLQRWLSSNWKWALPLAGVVVIGAGVAGVVLIKKIINKPEVTRFSPSAEKNDNKIEPTPPQEPAKTEKKQ